MKKGLVSVIIPAYNGQDFINETITSVLGQTYKNFELIIIDDGSKDKTAEIVKSFKDKRIKYFYQKNQGVAAARNNGIKKAKGSFLAFLDQDDLWMPEKLEKQLPLFKDKEVGLVYSDTIFFNKKGTEKTFFSKTLPLRGKVFKKLLFNYPISVVSVIIRREIINNLEFDSRLGMIEDKDLFLRIAHDWKIDFVDEVLARYRVHEKNFTWTKGEVIFKEIDLMLDKLSKIYPNFNIPEQTKKSLKKQAVSLAVLKFLLNGENKKSREIISDSEVINLGFLALYSLSFFPSFISKKIINKLMHLKQIVSPFN